jgi:hypothetical protein
VKSRLSVQGTVTIVYLLLFAFLVVCPVLAAARPWLAAFCPIPVVLPIPAVLQEATINVLFFPLLTFAQYCDVLEPAYIWITLGVLNAFVWGNFVTLVWRCVKVLSQRKRGGYS